MEGINEEVAVHKLSIRPKVAPVQQKARAYSGEKEIAIKEEVGKLVRAGIIEEAIHHTWIANVVMVKKSNNKWRMCVDYTDLNKACPKDCYPLPRIDKLVDSISGHRILSFIDAYSGYHQIKMFEPDRIHTAFRALGAIYQYKMMPFGLKNAGATYQRMVNSVFGSQLGRNLEAYIDDMVIKTKEENHAADLLETFANLRKNHMKLNPSKCAFGVTSGKFLGFMVSQKGIEANPEKIKALMNMKSPSTIKEIQQLNGRATALSRFVSRSAERCLPFFRALRGGKDFIWTEECERSFQMLKAYLGNPPLLTSPVEGDILGTFLAASDRAIAAVLVREEGNIQRPVYYVSHALTDVETRYLDAEKVALALVLAARRLRAYFMAHSIIVYTNVPLRKILHRPDVSGRMLRWSIELTEFDIDYKPRKVIGAQALADFVVETSFTTSAADQRAQGLPVEAEPSRPRERPTGYWSLFVDGSAGTEGSGAGILLIAPEEEDWFEKAVRFNFQCSNNQAEYEALITGLEMAKDIGVEDLVIFSDSQLVVKQVLGEYGTNHPLLIQYRQIAVDLLQEFRYWELQQIERARNERADELSRLATRELEEQREGVWFEFLEKPAYERAQVMDIDEVRDKDWVDEMMDYIEHGLQPQDPNQALLLRKRSPRYTVLNGTLYRRSFTQPLLRCIPPRMVDMVLEEVHQGICGGHPGARALADKIITYGYYWPSLRKDAAEFVKKCDKCQRHADIPRLPAETLKPIIVTWPFDIWGLDLVGLPDARGGVNHIIVAVDYFSKWIEAKPIKSLKEKTTMRFVRNQIWCRYGMPRAMVSDHGSNFGATFNRMLTDRGISHWQSAISHPEGNGQAEAANKLIVTALKKTLEDRKGKWIDVLDKILWGIRTTVRGPTGESPFSLVYGTNAMAPVELVIPSARVNHFDAEQNAANRGLDLDLLEERRLEAGLHMANYKKKAKEYFDKKVKMRSFEVGDLVLRKAHAAGHKPKKLEPGWEGPFIITAVVKEGTYRMSWPSGVPVTNPWHANNLKRYYV